MKKNKKVKFEAPDCVKRCEHVLEDCRWGKEDDRKCVSKFTECILDCCSI